MPKVAQNNHWRLRKGFFQSFRLCWVWGLGSHLTTEAGVHGGSQNVGRRFFFVITGPFYFFYNLASHVGKRF